jgi:CheY-like chemotaxis protein
LLFLFIEVSLLNRAIFRQYCSTKNIHFTITYDGVNGLEAYHLKRFDCIVVDCYMSDLSGYRVVKRIRTLEADEGRDKSFAIALTADNSLANQLRYKEVRFDDFLVSHILEKN